MRTKEEIEARIKKVADHLFDLDHTDEDDFAEIETYETMLAELEWVLNVR